jgi:hypothetical protein
VTRPKSAFELTQLVGATYLGDGLYVRADPRWAGQVELFAWNGIRAYERVYLDPSVLAAFVRWCQATGRLNA